MRKLVGANAAKLRIGRGMTQEQLAEKSGLSQQYISGLERGKRNPTILTVYELATALDVEPSTLLSAVVDERLADRN